VPRSPRTFIPGGTYHVFARGSNRQAIFRYDSDRADFLMCLERVVRQFDLSCMGYCLMPNHYHLVVETPDGALSEAMKALNGRYSLRFNRRHGRDAHLFRNRFGAVLQETHSQLLWTLRYLARNPVESGLCAEPGEWPWSSYRACTGLEHAPTFLDLTSALAHFGDMPERQMSGYRSFVA
jgi:REP element-mobilizing transposase RayT